MAGEPEGGTGRRLERLVGSGLAGPVVEALATYAADLENIKCAPAWGRAAMSWSQWHSNYEQIHMEPVSDCCSVRQ